MGYLLLADMLLAGRISLTATVLNLLAPEFYF